MDYKYHKTNKICDWKRRGLILRENETYEKFYELWVNAKYCPDCNVELDFSGPHTKTGRCLDHDHSTGYFRDILCNSCNHKKQVSERIKYKNNTTGIKNISYHKTHKHWVFKKTRNKKVFYKTFDTLQEAIDFKESF